MYSIVTSILCNLFYIKNNKIYEKFYIEDTTETPL